MISVKQPKLLLTYVPCTAHSSGHKAVLISAIKTSEIGSFDHTFSVDTNCYKISVDDFIEKYSLSSLGDTEEDIIKETIFKFLFSIHLIFQAFIKMMEMTLPIKKPSFPNKLHN